jgi:lysophospholipase L1-like esterase
MTIQVHVKPIRRLQSRLPVRTRSALAWLRPGEVVLFQGDSITDAFRKPDEVNNAYQLGSGYVMMAAAHLLLTRPADDLQFFNRGISGQTLVDLSERWQRDALDLEPTVISLLIGINDTGREVGGNTALSPAHFERDYRVLLLRSRKALPGVRLVLCEPFALPCGLVGEHWMAPLAEKQRTVAALAREFEAVFVPLQREFDTAAKRAPASYWIYDGIHPTAPGHQLIAQAWLRAVGRAALRDRPTLRHRARFARMTPNASFSHSTKA